MRSECKFNDYPWVISYYPDDNNPWGPYYVQRLSHLDYGRFSTFEAAKEHLDFCKEQDYDGI